MVGAPEVRRQRMPPLEVSLRSLMYVMFPWPLIPLEVA
jgi:hypothetical protein